MGHHYLMVSISPGTHKVVCIFLIGWFASIEMGIMECPQSVLMQGFLFGFLPVDYF